VVVLIGPRQSGKSTLVGLVAKGRAAEWRNLVGIEIKAASTVTAADFRGLRHLAGRIGGDFIAGIVFHTGTQTLPFGPRLRAMPVSALWQV